MFNNYYIDLYEIDDALLAAAESEADECTSCIYKGYCNMQCQEVEDHYNPNLPRL